MTYIDHFRRRWPAPNHCPASAPSANRSSTRTACGEHPRRSRRRLVSTLRELIGVAALCALASGCALPSAAPPSTPTAGRAPAPAQTTGQPPSPRPLDPQQVQRLQQIMVPLVRAMDRPPSLNQVKVGILADPHINAASAGGAEFYVTTGLLQKANDAQLAGVLAHELAHDDLRHVAKAQTLGLACPSACSSWIKLCLAAALDADRR